MRFLFFIIPVIFISASCSNNVENAVDYNEVIVLSYEKVADMEDNLMFHILMSDSIKFDSSYTEFLNQIESSKEEIESLGSFNTYSEFQEAALSMLDMYKDKAAQRLVELMNFMKGGSTEDVMDSTAYDVYFEDKMFELDSIIEDAFKRFENEQKKFAAKFGFSLM